MTLAAAVHDKCDEFVTQRCGGWVLKRPANGSLTLPVGASFVSRTTL